jgi:hypothetical protein
MKLESSPSVFYQEDMLRRAFAHGVLNEKLAEVHISITSECHPAEAVRMRYAFVDKAVHVFCAACGREVASFAIAECVAARVPSPAPTPRPEAPPSVASATVQKMSPKARKNRERKH